MKKALGSYPKFGEKDIPYAVKVFEKEALKRTVMNKVGGLSNMLKNAEKPDGGEIEIMGMLDHPNICKAFIAFDYGTAIEGSIFVLMQIGDLG